MQPDKQPLRVCDTCPFLACNKGKKHPAGWYKPANLRRLWNGLRTANAPGMVCHSSDPESTDYGSVKTVHPDTEKRQCAGALILVIKHCNEAGTGLRFWLGKYIMGGMSVESYRSDEIEVP